MDKIILLIKIFLKTVWFSYKLSLQKKKENNNETLDESDDNEEEWEKDLEEEKE